MFPMYPQVIKHCSDCIETKTKTPTGTELIVHKREDIRHTVMYIYILEEVLTF